MKEKKVAEEWVPLSDLPPLEEDGEHPMMRVRWMPISFYIAQASKKAKVEPLRLSWMPLELYLAQKRQ